MHFLTYKNFDNHVKNVIFRPITYIRQIKQE